MLIIKQFKALLRFNIAVYYREIESVSKELERALNGIADTRYIIDILYYMLIDGRRGIGMWICNYCEKLYNQDSLISRKGLIDYMHFSRHKN